MSWDGTRATIVQMLNTEKAEGNPVLLDRFARKRYWVYRAIAAQSASTPALTLIHLSEDPHEGVIRQLASNKDAPYESHKRLLSKALKGDYSPELTSDVMYFLLVSKSLTASDLIQLARVSDNAFLEGALLERPDQELVDEAVFLGVDISLATALSKEELVALIGKRLKKD